MATFNLILEGKQFAFNVFHEFQSAGLKSNSSSWAPPESRENLDWDVETLSWVVWAQPGWLSNDWRGMRCPSKPRDRQQQEGGSAVVWGEAVCSSVTDTRDFSLLASWLPWYVKVWLGGGKFKKRAPALPWCVHQRCRNQRRSITCCCTHSTAPPSRPSPRCYGSAAPLLPACRHHQWLRPCGGMMLSLQEQDPVSVTLPALLVSPCASCGGIGVIMKGATESGKTVGRFLKGGKAGAQVSPKVLLKYLQQQRKWDF